MVQGSDVPNGLPAAHHTAGPRQAQPDSHPSPSSRSHTPSAARSEPHLPDRAVSSDTIEDAYVSFIYYCNPAVPLESADTESLREAFRNPPRSGGKVFDPFSIYQLVQRFYDKDIKTWTELTIKLGVEPPDPSKDESTQKIAQYGVRLKKWMHSMHVKSFFEYLMGITNDYWTSIPSDPNPIGHSMRDGVAVEDDMALRALLPHIRPKRGRKRPESEDPSNPAAQRQRLSPGSAVDDARHQQWQNTPIDPRSAMPLDAVQTPASAWPPHDTAQTPLTRWPASAVTPSTRNHFWDENVDPGSAVTPSKAKTGSQRRGAKNVSSAWKLGGQEPSIKTRGRPPVNRTPIDTPSTIHAAWPGVHDYSQPSSESPVPAPAQHTNATPNHSLTSHDSHADSQQTQSDSTGQRDDHLPPPAPQAAFQQYQLPQQQVGQRPSRPSISLQVPERHGGSVRLATPPSQSQQFTPSSRQHNKSAPLPTYDNLHAPQAHHGSHRPPNSSEPSANWQNLTNTAPNTYQSSGDDPPGDAIPEYFFETIEDRTNIDPLMAYFIRLTHESDWFDANDNPAEPASMEEATAIVNSTLENMYRTAASSQAFLINLAALAGARMLMTNLTRCVRIGEQEDHTAYRCEWEYRFGHLHGYFNMAASVPFSMWRAPRPKERKHDGATKSATQDGDAAASVAASDADGDGDGSRPLPADHWQNKYKTLLSEVEKKDMELFRLRNKVMESLKSESRDD